DEAALHVAGQRGLGPVRLGAGGDRHDILVSHQQQRLGRGVAAGPGVEQAQRTDRLALERGLHPRVGRAQMLVQRAGLGGVRPRRRRSHRMRAGVWGLGGVSLLMDMSAEMIQSLLALFMVGALGASVVTVGWLEGLAESTALIVKVCSGVWSDRIGRRKGITL